MDFQFHGFTEGPEEVCVVRIDDHQFKMTISENGNWHILQQVPTWIKKLEEPLGAAIDEAYS